MTLLYQSGVVQMEKPSFIAWSGGDLRYILANRQYEAFMPPLQATLDTNAQGELETRVSANEQDNGLLMVLSWKRMVTCTSASAEDAAPRQLPLVQHRVRRNPNFEVERRLTQSASQARTQHWYFARKPSQSLFAQRTTAAAPLSN